MKYKIFFNKDFLNLVHNNIRNDEFKNNNNNIFSIGIKESKKNVYKTNVSIIKNNITINTLFYDLNHESKFSIFKKLFNKNIFDIKHFFLHNSLEEINYNKKKIFFKLQRIFYLFKKFVYLYKIKKAKQYNNKTLLLEHFKKNEKQLYIYDKNYLNCYSFTKEELYKICEKNIIKYDELLFYNSVEIKNPYNNINFTYTELVNIYFFLNYNLNKQFPLFHYYFKTNFNAIIFMSYYDIIIKNYVINDYYNNSNIQTKLSIFIQIINKYYPINIDTHLLNNDTLLNFYNSKKMIVYDYLIYTYSFDVNLSNIHYNIMISKLEKTFFLNPLLGRKKFIFENKKIINVTINNGNNLY